MPTTMTWDDENRLTQWNDGTTVVNSAYNGDGQRVSLDRNPGADFRWVWDGQTVLLELDNTNATLEIDTHEPGGYGGLISRRRFSGGSWVPRYCHFDAIGSLDGETDAAGTGYFNRFVYQAFGPLVAESNLSVPTNRRYVGRLGYYYDRITTALPLYVRARWLATNLGRWLSVDPLPQLIWTPYGYAYQDPTDFVDPSGLRCRSVLQPGDNKGGDSGNGRNPITKHPYEALVRWEAHDTRADVYSQIQLGTTTPLPIRPEKRIWSFAKAYILVSCDCKDGKCIANFKIKGTASGEGHWEKHRVDAKSELEAVASGDTITATGMMLWKYTYDGKVVGYEPGVGGAEFLKQVKFVWKCKGTCPPPKKVACTGYPSQPTTS